MDINTISLALSAAAFISSVFSPVAVAVINNRHARKMQLMQTWEAERRAAVLDFTGKVFACISNRDRVKSQDVECLKHAIGNMYLYVPRENWDYLETVSKFLVSGNPDVRKMRDGFEPFCKSLAVDINKSVGQKL